MFDLSNIKHIPIGMFVGIQDDLGPPSETRWERDQMKSVVFYKEYNQTEHSSFVMGFQTNTYLNDLEYLLRVFNH